MRLWIEVQGGSGESMVPDRAKVLVDARLLPNHDNESYIIPGVAISPDEKIVQILKRLDEEVMGVEPKIRGSGPASEGYMFIEAGIPTICGFGAEGDGVHSADEFLKLESLPKILEMYVRAAIEISS